MPRIMSANDLVRAVTELEDRYPGGLVPAVDVDAWCNKEGIDYGEHDVPVCKHFWKAEHEEARGMHRVLKFKREAKRTAPNYFALRGQAPRAPDLAPTHRARIEARKCGWVECAWI
jgi:hypothetical protein